jgi:hypothetical protein
MNNNLPHPLELVPSNEDSGKKAAADIHETQNLEAFLLGMIDQVDIQFIRIYGLRKQFYDPVGLLTFQTLSTGDIFGTIAVGKEDTKGENSGSNNSQKWPLYHIQS